MAGACGPPSGPGRRPLVPLGKGSHGVGENLYGLKECEAVRERHRIAPVLNGEVAFVDIERRTNGRRQLSRVSLTFTGEGMGSKRD